MLCTFAGVVAQESAFICEAVAGGKSSSSRRATATDSPRRARHAWVGASFNQDARQPAGAKHPRLERVWDEDRDDSRRSAVPGRRLLGGRSGVPAPQECDQVE